MLRFVALLGMLSLSVLAHAQQDSDLDTKTQLLESLTKALLQNDGQPLELGANMGWRGVVLIPAGTALPSIMTPFDAFGSETSNVSVLLENVSTFDRPLLVKDGTGHLSALSIADVWQSVLRKTQPNTVLDSDADSASDAAAAPWLFKTADEMDRIRGVQFLREPSDTMLRYREFESLYRVLTRAEQHDEGTWRLHPRLAQFGSVEEAKSALASDWLTYGHKTEVEAAWARMHNAPEAAAWRAWTEADARFTAGRRFLDLDLWVPQTVLFPPPSEWLGMGTWIRMTAPTPDPNIRASFQIARVRIMRPWLALDQLLSGQLKFPAAARQATGAVLSNGEAPSVLNYPEGLMAVIPEELVLIRGIRFMRGTEVIAGVPAAAESHPLARFSFPDATNLIAYVVRALPKTPK